MKSIYLPNLNLNVFTLLFLLVLIAGCGSDTSQPARRAGAAAVSVEVSVLRPQPIADKISTTGTLLANEEVEMRPEISGRVTKVLFQEGKAVKKGDLLVKINDRELTAQLKRKELEEKLATDEERRKHSLFEINGISQEEYDKVLNTLNMVKAEREVIESQLAETEIVAPFGGVIGLRYTSEGSYVTPATLVATMQDIDPVKVEFSVPEKYAGQMMRGTAVVVRVGESQDLHQGAVYAVEAKVEPATRTLKARATIPNPQARLIPGSFARVEITLEQVEGAIVIPSEALVPELSGQKVYVCRNGQAQSVPVVTGIRTERAVQITEGLKANDTLILSGLLQLSDGRPVQITTTVEN